LGFDTTLKCPECENTEFRRVVRGEQLNSQGFGLIPQTGEEIKYACTKCGMEYRKGEISSEEKAVA